MDAIIANAQMPFAAPQKPLPVANSPFTREFISNMNIAWVFARNDAGNSMWLVALSLHAHKLEHKSYPSQLRVLEGKYLKAIPADPFGGGEALRYKCVGESYVLWSVGPDKIDNGGKAIPYRKTFDAERRMKEPPQVQSDTKGDYVWGKNQ